MSRSTRKPYYYVVCCGPVQADRTLAARAVRRRQNREINATIKHGEFEDILLSHRYECANNNRWKWNCDGSPIYQSDKPSSWHLTRIGIYSISDLSDKSNRWNLEYHTEWIQRDRERHKELQRK